jgi:hypothetical protein
VSSAEATSRTVRLGVGYLFETPARSGKGGRFSCKRATSSQPRHSRDVLGEGRSNRRGAWHKGPRDGDAAEGGSILSDLIGVLLVAILGAIGWMIRTELMRRHELEDQLRQDRVSIYDEILEPYLIVFVPDAIWDTDPKTKGKNKNEVVEQTLRSFEYRKAVFRMSLICPDAIINAHNGLTRFFLQGKYHLSPSTEADNSKMLSLLGTLLLEIRKSMGNTATRLDIWAVLECLLPEEASKYRPKSR